MIVYEVSSLKDNGPHSRTQLRRIYEGISSELPLRCFRAFMNVFSSGICSELRPDFQNSYRKALNVEHRVSIALLTSSDENGLGV